MTAEVRSRHWRAIGTTCSVVVSAVDGTADPLVRELVTTAAAYVADLDASCSRFRPDSELLRLRHGTAVPASPMLIGALAAAVDAARWTNGLVDPTVGAALVSAGYDADLDVVRRRTTPTADDTFAEATPAPGYWHVHVDPAAAEVLIPHHVSVDLGSIAKAWAVDRLAERLGARLPEGAGVLVNLGGDLAVAGRAPADGWRVIVDDAVRPVVAVAGGALATSSTVRRTWRQAGRLRHHIVDPATGRPADPVWRTVTVAADNCATANAASTASVVLGAAAPTWLAERGLAARLVDAEGFVLTLGGFPADPASTGLAA